MKRLKKFGLTLALGTTALLGANAALPAANEHVKAVDDRIVQSREIDGIVEYAYYTSDVVHVEGELDRTENSIKAKVGNEPDGDAIIEETFTGKAAFTQVNGKWKNLEYAESEKWSYYRARGPTFLLGSVAHGATDIFSTTGSWVAPAGVTSVEVECWGGGGNGSTRSTSGFGGGGGGGAYAKTNAVTVVPTTSYSLTVGAAAADSWFSTTGVAPTATSEGCLADGGTSVANNTATGQAGGTTANSIGDTEYAGGTGGNGSSAGGGGGGGGGTTAAGGNGGDGTAGTGGSKLGGKGGTGPSVNSGGGGGDIRGGGGAGSRRTSGTQTGGPGGQGEVRVRYTGAANTIYIEDYAGKRDNSGTTITLDIEANGTNRLGYVFILLDTSGDTVSSVDWGGTAGTFVDNINNSSRLETWQVIAPPDSAATLTVTISSASSQFAVKAVAVSGAKQTGYSEYVEGTVDGVTSQTLSGLTAPATGSYGLAAWYSSGGGLSAGTNTTALVTGDPLMGHSGSESAGDFSMQTTGGSGNWQAAAVVIEPTAAASAAITSDLIQFE